MARVNRDDVDKWHDYSLYIPKRTIFIGSEENDLEHGESGVDGAMAERLIKNLTILEGISSEPIKIIMNNIGGDPYHGLAMYDAIKACESFVTIQVYGHAMSMGSVVLQAADERVMSPTSKQMIHYGDVSGSAHAKTFQKWAKECEKIDLWMEQMYLDKIKDKHPKITLAKVRSLLNHDTFLTAQESVDLGLADKILGESENT